MSTLGFDWRTVPRLVWLYENREDYRLYFDELDQGIERPTIKLPTRPEVDQVNLCLYRECRESCQSSKCWARLHGDQWEGEPFTRVTLAQCVACMSDMR